MNNRLGDRRRKTGDRRPVTEDRWPKRKSITWYLMP